MSMAITENIHDTEQNGNWRIQTRINARLCVKEREKEKLK